MLHIVANTIKKVPERIMKHLAKKIFKSIEKEHGEIPAGINTEIPDYKAIEDHKEARNKCPCDTSGCDWADWAGRYLNPASMVGY